MMPEVKKRGALWLVFLMAVCVLAGCSRGTVRTDHRDAAFSLDDLRLSHSVLVASHNVRVTAFERSYATAYGRPDSLAARLSRSILDSLHKTPALSIRPPPGPRLRVLLAADTLSRSSRAAADSLMKSMGTKYVVHIRAITIGYSMRDVHLAAAVRPDADMASAKDDSRPYCVVSLEVEVLKSPGMAKPYVFTVKARAKVVLQAYQAALEEAVHGAARETAMHVRGY